MMTTCARCGLPNRPEPTDPASDDVCFDAATRGTGDNDWAALACRDRELANLRALLRSVTGNLESAREYLDGAVDRYAAEAAAAEIDAVLEILS